MAFILFCDLTVSSLHYSDIEIVVQITASAAASGGEAKKASDSGQTSNNEARHMRQ